MSSTSHIDPSNQPADLPSVIIAGAGLGGLTLGQALHRHGIPVAVYEADHTAFDRPQGYRLHLEADALAALREVLPPERHQLFLATAMHTTANTTILNTDLDVVKKFWTDDNLDPVVFPDYAQHIATDDIEQDDTISTRHCNVDRATLREILLDGLGDVVHFDKIFQRYDLDDSSGVTVSFTDGTSVHADILVGADGVRSTVRAQRAPHLGTIDAGVQAIYGRIPWPAAEGHLSADVLNDVFSIAIDERKVFLGLGAVRFPRDPYEAATNMGVPGAVTHRDSYFVCIVGGRHEHFPNSHDELRHATPEQLQDMAGRIIGDWPEQARALIAVADPDSFFSVGMWTSVPGHLEPQPNVTLLGDAIHAMTPTLGRGANLALRDAALLARAIRDIANNRSAQADALASYEQKLTDYGWAVVRESAEMGRQRMAQDPLPT